MVPSLHSNSENANVLEEHIPDEWAGKIPKLVRYTQRAFVDAFFERGELMLTTFERCSQSDDLTRVDRREGKVNSFVRTGEGRAIAGIHGVGRNSYMLCTSLVESEVLMQTFEGSDDYFLIDDPRGFAIEVSRVLPGYQQGLMGPCVYMSERSVETDDPGFEPNLAALIQAMTSGDEVAATAAVEQHQRSLGSSFEKLIGSKPYFSKVASTHEDESEFRFVWLVDHPTGTTPLLINAPAATRHCSRRTLSHSSTR